MSADLFQRRGAALDEVGRLEEAKARAFAQEARVLAELAVLYAGDDSLFLELAGTARIGQLKAAGQTDRARRLVELFPVALRLLEAGRLFVGTAQMLLALTKNCSEQVQSAVDRRLSARVAGLDAVDARALISATVVEVEAELDREEQQRRYAQARAGRGVWVKPVEDGMARIGAEVDAVAAKEFALGLEALERAQAVADERAGVARTKAQRMADLLVELPARHLGLLEALRSGRVDALLAQALVGEAPAVEEPPRPWELPVDELAVALLRLPVRRPRTLNIHVAASTVLGLDDRACLVEGIGPLPGWMSRVLLPDAALRRVLVDRATGQPLHVGDRMPPLLEVDLGHGPPRPDQPPGPGPRRREPPDGPPGRDADVSGSAEVEADRQLEAAFRQRRRLSALVFAPATLPGAEPQYAPSARLRDLVQLRDLRCTGPGCARAACGCDLDHERTYADGGPTAADNLSAKSRRCHLARHRDWDVVRDRVTGVSTWTSPLGRVYTRLPAWRPLPEVPDVVLGAPAPRRPASAGTDSAWAGADDRPLCTEPVSPVSPVAAAPGTAGASALRTTSGSAAAGPVGPGGTGAGWDRGGPPPF